MEQVGVGGDEPRLAALKRADEVPRDVVRQIPLKAESKALLPVPEGMENMPRDDRPRDRDGGGRGGRGGRGGGGGGGSRGGRR